MVRKWQVSVGLSPWCFRAPDASARAPLGVEGQWDKNKQKSRSGEVPTPFVELFTQLGSAFGWLAGCFPPPPFPATSAQSAAFVSPPQCPESRGLCSLLRLDSMRPGEATAFRAYLEVNKSQVAALCLHYKPRILPPLSPHPSLSQTGQGPKTLWQS